MDTTTYDELYSELSGTVDSVVKKNAPKFDAKGLRRKAIALGAVTALIGSAGGLAYALTAQPERPPDEYLIPGEFIVQFDRDVTVREDASGSMLTGLSEVDSLNALLEGESYRQMAPSSDEDIFDRFYLVDIDDSLDLDTWMERFDAAEGVQWAGYNVRMSIPDLPDLPVALGAVEAAEAEAGRVPNDPFYKSSGSWDQPFEDLWGLRRSGASEAWELTTGNADLVFAVVDTGIANDHPDIVDRMWRNPNEVAGNGLDDDHNGYIDDVFGINAINPQGTSYDGHGHGTHVAGTIAATTDNNLGVAGINWQGRLMAVKVLSDSGSGDMFSIAAGIVYAARNGADVINMSLGGPAGPFMLPVDLAIRYATYRDVITVVAAGNSNRDSMYFSPADHPQVITVAAINYDGTKAPFSNWGRLVDVAAPGMSILSTVPRVNQIPPRYPIVQELYSALHGTSMASPHVAGEVGLILAVRPDLRGEYREVRDIVQAGVMPFPQKPDHYIGTGRINYRLAVEEAIRRGK